MTSRYGTVNMTTDQFEDHMLNQMEGWTPAQMTGGMVDGVDAGEGALPRPDSGPAPTHVDTPSAHRSAIEARAVPGTPVEFFKAKIPAMNTFVAPTQTLMPFWGQAGGAVSGELGQDALTLQNLTHKSDILRQEFNQVTDSLSQQGKTLNQGQRNLIVGGFNALKELEIKALKRQREVLEIPNYRIATEGQTGGQLEPDTALVSRIDALQQAKNDRLSAQRVMENVINTLKTGTTMA